MTTKNPQLEESKRFGYPERLYEISTKQRGLPTAVWRVAAPNKREALAVLDRLMLLEEETVVNVKRVSFVDISPKTLRNAGLV
jgi:hypothetical protein